MPPPCSRRPALAARRSASRPRAAVLEALLDRRIVFVAGKGGTGKTTVAAALCLLAARRGKEVLGVEVDAKGDLSAALGSHGASFRAEVAQPGVSVLSLHAEESFQEYLRIYFKVPRLARLTPLSRVFDFIATAVPGPRDMLVTGKIAFEERRRDDTRRPVWDLIVVDCSATGHVLAQLRAARSMLELVRGGIIRNQIEWIDGVISDSRRTAAILTALPEEMPVVETVELRRDIARQNTVHMALCVLNRMPPKPMPAAARRVLADLATADAQVRGRLPGVAHIGADLELGERLFTGAQAQARQLRAKLDLPVVEVPLLAERTGLATTRAVVAALRQGAGGA
ncbi:MAG: ArsA-related P-loop ATPase [Candidatus Dormibacteria bacterium]